MSIIRAENVTDEHGTEHRLVTFQCDGPECPEQTTLDPRLPLFDPQPMYDWGSIEGCGSWSAPDDELPVSAHFHTDACMVRFVLTTMAPTVPA